MVLFLALLAVHIPMQLNISDDGNFGTYLENMSLWELMARIYLTGSGKVLPDAAGALFAYLPWWIWKVLDSGIRTGMAACIVYVFTDRSMLGRWIGVVAVLFYPNSLLLSAGYCVTSTNYVWTAAAVLFTLVILRDVSDGVRVKPWKKLAAIACCVYGANQEQGAAILIASHMVFIVYAVISGRKVNPVVYVNLGVAVAVLAVFVTSPGFRLKSVPVCNTVALPYFTTMGFMDKVLLGFTTTCAHFMSGWNIVWLVFLLLLGVLGFVVMLRNAGRVSKVSRLVPLISVLPLCAYLGILFLFPKLGRYFYNVTEWSFGMGDFLPVDTANFNDWKAYVPVVAAILMLAVLMLGMYCIYGGCVKTLLMMVVFMAGLCSRMTMGFSYTVFGSGSRTFTYMYFCLIVLIVVLGIDVVRLAFAGNNAARKAPAVVSVRIVSAGIVAAMAAAVGVSAARYASNVVIKPYNLPEDVVMTGLPERLDDAAVETSGALKAYKYEGKVSDSDIKYSVDVADDGTYTTLSGWCIQEGQDTGFFDVKVLLVDVESGSFYSIKTDYKQVYNLTIMMDDGHDYENGGFTARFKDSALEKLLGDTGRYGIALLYHGGYLVVAGSGIA
jgi:hypothetical protein